MFRQYRPILYAGRVQVKKNMKRRPKNVETTTIVWNSDYEFFQCTKCKNVMHYNLGFVNCPYCGRMVTKSDKRGVSIGTNDIVMKWS